MKTIFAVITLSIAALAQVRVPGPGGVSAVTGGGGGACTPAFGYSHCRVLTIDHTQVAGTLTDFPVLVRLSLGPSRIASAYCYDLVFTSDSGGSTLVPWEQESGLCDSSAGTYAAWVLAASISSSVDTTLYASYGNSGIVTAQNTGSNAPTRVWDNNFVGVYHLPNGSVLTTTDSTSNGYHLTPCDGSTAPSASAGQIGGAASFVNGATTYLCNGAISVNGDVTISYWLNTPGNVPETNWSFMNITGGSRAEAYSSFGDGTFYFDWGSNGGSSRLTAPFGAYENTNVLVALTGRGDNTGQAIYFNGSSVASLGTNAAPTAANRLYIGVSGDEVMDEVRVSNTVRSGAWIAAEYKNQKSNSTFVGVGSEI